MQALHDDERVGTIEQKIDDGFAEMRTEFKTVRTEMKRTERELRTEIVAVRSDLRSEIVAVRTDLRGEIITARSDARADFRTLVAVSISLWAATALTILAAHL